MRFVIHSPGELFSDALREYCEVKLTKPIDRHRFDGDAVMLDVDANPLGEGVELKVRLRLPHCPSFTVNASHDDAYAAIDRLQGVGRDDRRSMEMRVMSRCGCTRSAVGR